MGSWEEGGIYISSSSAQWLARPFIPQQLVDKAPTLPLKAPQALPLIP
jgi:hypothetical protein